MSDISNDQSISTWAISLNFFIPKKEYFCNLPISSSLTNYYDCFLGWSYYVYKYLWIIEVVDLLFDKKLTCHLFFDSIAFISM